jgi:flagellar hook-length control protein FliK
MTGVRTGTTPTAIATGTGQGARAHVPTGYPAGASYPRRSNTPTRRAGTDPRDHLVGTVVAGTVATSTVATGTVATGTVATGTVATGTVATGTAAGTAAVGAVGTVGADTAVVTDTAAADTVAVGTAGADADEPMAADLRPVLLAAYGNDNR